MFKLIVDVEATCTDSDEFPRHEMEIIEIGAVILKNDVFYDKYQGFIKPVKNPILTKFCKNLTGIEQEWLAYSDTFKIGMVDFLSWIRDSVGTDPYTFYSWGDFDKNIFSRQCNEYGIDASKMLSSHINAKKLFAEHFNLRKQLGVDRALKYHNMEFDGDPHRALDDAINITRLIDTIV